MVTLVRLLDSRVENNAETIGESLPQRIQFLTASRSSSLVVHSEVRTLGGMICHLLNGVQFPPCGKDHFARKILVDTWDLRHMWLWCMDWCHESVMCVDVQCG